MGDHIHIWADWYGPAEERHGRDALLVPVSAAAPFAGGDVPQDMADLMADAQQGLLVQMAFASDCDQCYALSHAADEALIRMLAAMIERGIPSAARPMYESIMALWLCLIGDRIERYGEYCVRDVGLVPPALKGMGNALKNYSVLDDGGVVVDMPEGMFSGCRLEALLDRERGLLLLQWRTGDKTHDVSYCLSPGDDHEVTFVDVERKLVLKATEEPVSRYIYEYDAPVKGC